MDYVDDHGDAKNMGQRVSAAFFQKLRHKLEDDSGVAGLVIVGIIAVIAFSALSVFLNKYIGDRAFERLRASGAEQSLVGSALTAHFLRDENYKIACPDTNYDGLENTPCDAAATVYKGVVPWITVGLSREQAIDPHGDYYTYLVSGTANGYNALPSSTPHRGLCESVTSDFDGTVEFTGDLLGSDLELLTTAQTANQTPTQGRNVPFVIISHGANRLGAVSASGVTLGPPSSTYEELNARSSPAVSRAIYSGPYNDGKLDADDYFDDQVFAPPSSDVVEVCEQLTPGGKQNADIADGFDNPALVGENFNSPASNGVAIINKNGNNVARFTGAAANAPRRIASTAAFNPSVRPIYFSTEWTPNPTYDAGSPATHATVSGLSIATRATDADRSTFDLYNAGSYAGISFRFYSGGISGAGVNNNISIFHYTDATTVEVIDTSDTTYSLRSNATYIVEVYDDGTNVWARITEQGNTSNTAMVSSTSDADLVGDQGVTIHTISDILVIADIDDVLLGRPMLAVETTGADAVYAGIAGANGSSSGNVSVEAWIRPRGLPSAGNRAVIVGQWDTTNVDASSYRMYLDSDGQLNLQVAGTIGGVPGTETFGTGIVPALDNWTHVAVTFNASTKSVNFYKNGAAVRSAFSSTGAGTGVRAAGVTFGIGADFAGSTASPVDGYNGDISDVRVWTDVRAASEIARYYRRRLAGVEATAADTAELAGLAVNWKLDSESGGLASIVALATPTPGYGADGTRSSDDVTYVPALAVYVRPNAREFCPSGTVARLYQCDFRAGTAWSFAVPSRLPTVYAKAWGGGGGGAVAVFGGTGGGFAGGTIRNNEVGNWALTLGLGGATGVIGGDGTSSTVARNAVTLVQGTPGLGGDLNILNSLVGVVSGLVFGSTTSAGSVPDAANNDDPFYSPAYLATYLGGALQNPATGGAVGANGRNGALVLLW